MATFESSLPTETKQNILQLVVEGETDPQIRYHTLYCLQSVAKWVKRIVDNAPAMWTLLALDVSRIQVDKTSTDAAAQIQEEIANRVASRATKAKLLPVTFLMKHTKHIYHKNEALCVWCSVMESGEAVSVPFDRIAYLSGIDVSLPPSHMQRIFNTSAPSSYFHRLEEVSLENTDPRQTLSPKDPLFENFPLISLRKLSLTYALIAELAWALDSPPRLPELRELYVKSDSEEEVTIISHILPQCPKLVHLTWSSPAPREAVHPPRSRCRMEFLKELEIHSDNGRITEETLSSVHFPTLEKVLLTVWNEHPDTVEAALDFIIPPSSDLVTQVKPAPKSLHELVNL